VRAQDDDVPLGDVARATRKAKPAEEETVIDNDNLHVMMDKAESARLDGKPVFSIDPSGKSFRMTSLDGTCSLSFDARATALISTPFVSSELPQDDLLKLEGPAAIHDDVLEVSLHNGSGWEVKEIVVGITVLQSAPELKPTKLLTADSAAPQKSADLTMLYHLKATALPDSLTVFRGNLGGDLDSAKDWHWALVSARGIPPAAPGSVAQPTDSMPAFSSPEASVTKQPPPSPPSPTTQISASPAVNLNTAIAPQPASKSIPATTPPTQH
jgi:hypothetical protein